MKLNAQELRTVSEPKAIEQAASLPRHPLYLVLENIYDTYNVGGLFRLADALAVKKIYLCGQTEVPPNSRIKKASIGTYKLVPWEYKKTALEAIADIKRFDPTVQTVAVEQHERATPLAKLEINFPLAFLVGNETVGVTTEALDAVDHIVEIPMWGINKSLNVIVSAAIVAYQIMLKNCRL